MNELADDTAEDGTTRDKGKEGIADRWRTEIERAESDKTMTRWNERAKKVVDLYADRSETSRSETKRRYAILYSNISTLQPAVYSRMPQPSVGRRFKDNDPVGRTASEMVERCVAVAFDAGRADNVFRSARDDLLLEGRGFAWARYEPVIGKKVAPDGQEYDALISESVVYEHLGRDEVRHPQAKSWDKLPWLSRIACMTRDECIDRFGQEVGSRIPLDHKPANGRQDDTADNKAAIYEIWSKVDGKVYWLSKGEPEILDVSEPPLRLEGFFPCPRPAYSTLIPGTLTPVPDYVYYQDQAEELNDLTQRIGALTDALKLVGFYPATGGSVASAIQLALSAGQENQLVPVPDWAAFSEKGGSNQIQWLPVDQVAKIITQCVELRKELINDINQITGIPDIFRGESDAQETATAQGIKSDRGSLRIRDRQTVMAQFVRDLARITAEIMADKFQPETLMAMSNMTLPSDEDVAMMQMQQQMMAMQAQPALGGPMMPPAGASMGPPPGAAASMPPQA